MVRRVATAIALAVAVSAWGGRLPTSMGRAEKPSSQSKPTRLDMMNRPALASTFVGYVGVRTFIAETPRGGQVREECSA